MATKQVTELRRQLANEKAKNAALVRENERLRKLIGIK